MNQAKRSITLSGIAFRILVFGGGIFFLITIFLPSRGGSHIKTPLTACLSNLKQIGLATYMYQGENSGQFPSAGTTPAKPNDWIRWQPGRDPTKAVLVPYMGNAFIKKVYICPSDKQKRPAGVYQYSYTANINFYTGGVPSPQIPHESLRYFNIKSPSTKILLVEEDENSIDDAAWEPQHTTPASNKNTLAVRHEKFRDTPGFDNSKSTAAFADGHAEYIERRTAMEPRTYDPLLK